MKEKNKKERKKEGIKEYIARSVFAYIEHLFCIIIRFMNCAKNCEDELCSLR
jgi:hypothetical protein